MSREDNTLGNYSLKLQATSINGCTDSLSKTFAIQPQAKVSIAAVNEFCQDSSLQFNGSAESAVIINKWYWNFGDNTNDTLQNPQHTFTAADTFSVRLYALTEIWLREVVMIACIVVFCRV